MPQSIATQASTQYSPATPEPSESHELSPRELCTAVAAPGMPDAVERTVIALQGLGIDFAISRNDPAFGCADAAAKRHRQGVVGIPLCDELKSLFLVCHLARSPGGDETYLFAHCRGDRRMDFEKVGELVDAKTTPHLVAGKDLKNLGWSDLGLGLVNPFRYRFDGPFLFSLRTMQIFDEDLLTPRLPRDATVMTNAGDLTWAIEFRPLALFEALRNRSNVKLLRGNFSIPDH